MYILWDFDGTLAYRPGLWSGCLLEVLDENEPGHPVRREDISLWLRDGFPWHRHTEPHPELGRADAWWRHVERILAQAYERVGYPNERATTLAQLARRRYLDITGWRLFDDALPVLERLRSLGWRHVILSNHVPELPSLVEGIGLAGAIDRVVTSAATGYEKPHPEAFAAARVGTSWDGPVWMVGDNLEADIRGAEALGIPAILVRSRPEGVVTYRSDDLWGVIEIVENTVRP